MLPDPADQPTLDATEVAQALNIGVTLARQMGRRYITTDGADGVPCVAYGRLLKFPTASVRQHLGIDPPTSALLRHPRRADDTLPAGAPDHDRSTFPAPERIRPRRGR